MPDARNVGPPHHVRIGPSVTGASWSLPARHPGRTDGTTCRTSLSGWPPVAENAEMALKKGEPGSSFPRIVGAVVLIAAVVWLLIAL